MILPQKEAVPHIWGTHEKILKKEGAGTKISELSEQYPGQERHKALKRFDALRKQFPGIESVKDIEKRQWER